MRSESRGRSDGMLRVTMAPRQRHAVWLLGLCQCVLWGVLYYGFSVLLVPIAADSHVPRITLAAAFSSGLAAMALLAPTVGRWLDAGHFACVARARCAVSILGLLTLATPTA